MKFINKLNKLSILQEIIYWILSWTWGIIMTLIGVFPAIILLVTGHKPQVFGWDICFVVGKNWGGVSFGVFIFVDSTDNFYNKCHEHGHGLQNILMGPFFPFIVGIRSTIRYWMRERAGYDDKIVFCTIVTSAMELVSLVGITLGYVFNNLAVIIVAILALAYTVYLDFWLWLKELPKYKSGERVPYDDFWVEKQATQWGETFMLSGEKEWE